MLKKPILTYLAKITDFSISLVFKSIIESGVINIHKIRGPNSHAAFSPKKNF